MQDFRCYKPLVLLQVHYHNKERRKTHQSRQKRKNLAQHLGWYHAPGLHESLQPCSRAARKWRENEEMKRKWRENEEMKRKWRENEEMEREIHSQDFLILCLFSPSLSISYIKFVTFCRKMLNTALLSRMSQKN